LQCFIDDEPEKAWQELASYPAMGTIKLMEKVQNAVLNGVT
jgi:hypothetical protein